MVSGIEYECIQEIGSGRRPAAANELCLRSKTKSPPAPPAVAAGAAPAPAPATSEVSVVVDQPCSRQLAMLDQHPTLGPGGDAVGHLDIICAVKRAIERLGRGRGREQHKGDAAGCGRGGGAHPIRIGREGCPGRSLFKIWIAA